MHSFLITNWSGSLDDLPPFITSRLPNQVPPGTWHHPDIFIIEPNPSITINQIRKLRVWLSRKPYQSPTKAALIFQAHTLTLPAQHALLKSLEEPPANTIIILATNQPDSLLPTIHSRCQLIHLSTPSTSGVALDSPEVDNLTPGQRIALTQTYTIKDQALSLCLNLIHSLRPQLKLKPTRQLARQLRLLHQTSVYLSANVNPKLAMEHLFLNL
ncbi:MAG: hypothetical protein HY381_02675 [Candidatus Chisholmbacteria bacterium]|nr:hypothetical protein [Candidatus Chisholmbacteria bacterium]